MYVRIPLAMMRVNRLNNILLCSLASLFGGTLLYRCFPFFWYYLWNGVRPPPQIFGVTAFPAYPVDYTNGRQTPLAQETGAAVLGAVVSSSNTAGVREHASGTGHEQGHREFPGILLHYAFNLGLPVQHRLAGEAYIFCCCTFFLSFFLYLFFGHLNL